MYLHLALMEQFLKKNKKKTSTALPAWVKDVLYRSGTHWLTRGNVVSIFENLSYLLCLFS